jgi:hypothetical protein
MPKVKAAMPCVEKAPLSTVAMVAFNLLGNPKNRNAKFPVYKSTSYNF